MFYSWPSYIGIIYFNTVAGGKNLDNLMQVIGNELIQFFVPYIPGRNKKQFFRNIFNVM